MCFSGTFVGRAGRVSPDHLPGPPAGQAHQIPFLAAGVQPRVGERVAELMRVDVAKTGGLGAD
jgi:hypothetical protein